MKIDERVSICGISYELGMLRLIEDGLSSEDSSTSINELLEKGLNSYSEFQSLAIDAIQISVSNSIRLAGINYTDIDGVLIVTESFTGYLKPPTGISQFRATRNLLFDILTEIGVVNVPFFCSTFGGSSNFLQAVSLARPIVENGQFSNLLVVCIDQMQSEHSRIMDAAVAVTGDGVATCIITREPRFTSTVFSIEHIGISPYLTSGHQAWNRMVLEMYRATKNAAADCYERLGLQPNDFEWLVLANYNELSSQVFSRLLGFNLDRIFLKNISRTGHIPSCDSLINLMDISCSTSLKNDSHILIFLNGPISCGTISLVVRTQ